MEKNAEPDTDTSDEFLLIPANGGGAVVHSSQIAGARKKWRRGTGSYMCTRSGPSIYTTLSTRSLAKMFGARMIEARG